MLDVDKIFLDKIIFYGKIKLSCTLQLRNFCADKNICIKNKEKEVFIYEECSKRGR